MTTPAYRVLVVGGGSIGERHARCFLRTGRCRVAVCDVDRALLARLGERYPLAGTFAGLEAALAEPWDAAVVATPAHLHMAQALSLARAGAHLLIEKPLATTLAGVAALREEVARGGRTAGAAYVLRAHPAVEEVRARLEAGEIGPVRHVVAAAGQHFPTFRPAYREIYYARRASGGGAVQDALTHLANLVQHLAGPWSWVFADREHQVLPGVEVEDTVNAVGRLGGGSLPASVSLNQFMAPNETVVSLHGERGSLRLELHHDRWGALGHGETEWRFSPPLLRERDELFTRQADRFLDAVEGRGSARGCPVLCPLEEAEQTLRFNLAALYSGPLRRPVALAEVDETFDPAAIP